MSWPAPRSEPKDLPVPHLMECNHRSEPEVGFEEMAVDLLQARLWIVSPLPTIRASPGVTKMNRTAREGVGGLGCTLLDPGQR